MDAVIQNFSTINTDAVIVGVVSFAILIVAPYIFKKIPGSLLAVIAGIVHSVDDDTPDIDEHLRQMPLQIRVYEISGPLFFGAADVIEHIAVKDFTTCLVLRMRGVTALDSTAMNALIDTAKACEKRGITVVFSHVNKQPMKVVDKAGFIERIGKEKKF